VQTARGFIGLARELSARVQDGHDDLQRRLAGVFGVRVYGNTPPVVLDAERAVGRQDHLDQLGVSCDRLVHGVIQDFSKQVMEGPLIGPANVHAGALADGLQTLEDLDVLGGVSGLSSTGHGRLGHRLGRRRRRGLRVEQGCLGRGLGHGATLAEIRSGLPNHLGATKKGRSISCGPSS